MKVSFTTRLILALAFVASLLQLHAQSSTAPQGFNYQSVARDASGSILTNRQIAIQVSIRDTSSAGAIVYKERHVVVTNAFGTFSVVVGGGSIITGTLGNIQWGASTKYMQVEMDFTGGTNYTNMGTAQLMSVPYSLYTTASAGDIQSIKYDTTGILNIRTGNAVLSPVRGAWLTGGNGGLNNTNNYIGTTDNMDLIFQRGRIEAIRYTAGGAFLATGSATTGVTPASGPGKRMEWIPAKGAFRAGTVTGTAWDHASIGNNSIALGNDALASGAGAISIGNNTQALGSNSVAMGNGVVTRAANAMVIGTYNDTTARAADSIQPSNVLFQIGNGTSASNRGNALTVSKDGIVVASQLLVTQSMTLSDSTITVNNDFAINPNYAFYKILTTSGGHPELTMGAGKRAGQMVILEAITSGGGGHDVRLIDGTATRLNLKGSQGTQIDLASTDTITLIWDGTLWVQMGYSSNN